VGLIAENGSTSTKLWNSYYF